jgi:hypothetical protein
MLEASEGVPMWSGGPPNPRSKKFPKFRAYPDLKSDKAVAGHLQSTLRKSRILNLFLLGLAVTAQSGAGPRLLWELLRG